MSKRKTFGAHDYSLDTVESRRDRVVVAFSWADNDGQRHGWAQALRLKDDGKIVDIQDYGNRRSAVASIRLRTAFG
jgi:hypothetical protein